MPQSHNCPQCHRVYGSYSALNRHINERHSPRDRSRSQSRSLSPYSRRSCNECRSKDAQLSLIINEINFLRSHIDQLSSLLDIALKSNNKSSVGLNGVSFIDSLEDIDISSLLDQTSSDQSS